MTITEINNLLLADALEIIEYRVKSNNYDIENPEVVYSPSSEELDAEFIIYIAELTSAETERLRLKDLEDRVNSLTDKRAAHRALTTNIPNASRHIKDTILINTNHTEAENNLQVLEAKDAELQAAINSTAWVGEREEAYPTLKELIIAMWEGDQAEKDRLEAIRQQVKLDIRKP